MGQYQATTCSGEASTCGIQCQFPSCTYARTSISSPQVAHRLVCPSPSCDGPTSSLERVASIQLYVHRDLQCGSVASDTGEWQHEHVVLCTCVDQSAAIRPCDSHAHDSPRTSHARFLSVSVPLPQAHSPSVYKSSVHSVLIMSPSHVRWSSNANLEDMYIHVQHAFECAMRWLYVVSS